MKKKLIIIFILVAIIAAGIASTNYYPFIFIFGDKMARLANKNEAKLYERRADKDPSFKRLSAVVASTMKIDVVIPAIEKDLEILPHTISGIRNYVNHPIGKIFLISPPTEKMIQFAEDHNLTFVDENEVSPSPKIKEFGGWMLQQFLKLNADKIVEQEHFLAVDADTIYIRPQVFEFRDQYLVNVNLDTADYRKKITAKYLGNTNVYPYDLVTHNMLFSKEVLTNMKQHVEKRFGKTWHEAFTDSFVDKEYKSGFAEYDIYMTYLTQFSGKKFRFVSNANVTVYRDYLPKLDAIKQVYGADYKSISLHHFVMAPKPKE